MDQEDKNTLRKVLELEQKNNKMLLSIKQSMMWGRIFRYAYWIVIIGAAVGAYYYIQPYIDGLIEAYGGFKGDIQNVRNIFN